MAMMLAFVIPMNTSDEYSIHLQTWASLKRQSSLLVLTMVRIKVSSMFGEITKPLIILQGANDPRVIKAESDDMVAAIEANNGIVEYLVFDDEGHGFAKNDNRIEGWNAILAFLDAHLAAETGN